MSSSGVGRTASQPGSSTSPSCARTCKTIPGTNLVISRIVGLRGDLASNTASLAEATATTFEATRQPGRDAVAAQVDTVSGTSAEEVWRGVIDILYRMARDPNFDARQDLNAPAFGWLDAVRYRTPGETYDTRFARFAALMAKLGGLSGIRGPTARALRRSLQL